MFDHPTRKVARYHVEPKTVIVDAAELGQMLRRDAQGAATVRCPRVEFVALSAVERAIRKFAKYGRERLSPSLHGVVDAYEREDWRGQVEREFLALHARKDGVTVAGMAARNLRFVPEELRDVVLPLNGSYWDLYEVVEHRDAGCLLESRFDGTRVVVSSADGLDRGDLVVARAVDLGHATMLTSALVPSYRQLGQLVVALSKEFVGGDWAEFMRTRGSRIVVEWAKRIEG